MIFENSISYAESLDLKDPLKSCRDKFHYPINRDNQEVIYFCGNSLGLQPKSVQKFISKELDIWKTKGVLGQHLRWERYHEMLSKSSARLVGAKSTEVVVMNALTVNLNLLLVSFYRPDRIRNKIIIEKGAFPSDQYAVESQINFHGYDPRECLIELQPRKGETSLRTKDIIDVINTNADSLATIILGGINYYTGQAIDMKSITSAGHAVGAYVGFDLAHAAGNLVLELHNWKVDFAVWCTYKYLCAGPGSPSGIFINNRHHVWTGPRFEGWWGHNKKTRFRMEPNFDPIPTAEGWQISNAPVIGMAPLLASMEIFNDIGMPAIRNKSEYLTNYLEFLIQNNVPEVPIITPKERGCQLSLVPQNGKKIFDYLMKKDVICDWREPGVIRIAPHPLFNSFLEVYKFVKLLEEGL